MKKRKNQNLAKLLFVGLGLSVTTSGQGQDILDLMSQDAVSLEEVRLTANSYFDEVGTGSGSGYKLFKRWEYHAMTVLQPDGRIISRDAMASALADSRATAGDKTISASDWQELGPLAWTNTSGYNPGVGRVTAIAVEPTSQQIIYIGSPGGGLWKSINGGSSWTPIGDDFSNMTIWSIEIDPVNVNTVYIGNSAGDVYRSTDAGGSFTLILNNSNPVTDILINPIDTDEIYAALRYSGLFRTTNGGTSWTEVITAGIEDVMYKPGSTSTVYACGNNFYKSTDGGSSFSQVTSGFSASERMKLAVTPNNSNYVYVVQKRGGGFGYLYRSTDSGNNFSVRVDYTTDNYIGSQASRDMAIAVSNTNANEVHIGGFNMYKSLNGGTSFTKECDWYYPNTTSGVYEYVHADIEVMQYIDGTIYVGSDGGIFKSTNAGNDFTDLSIGLGIHQFYRINSSSSDRYRVAGGAQDNGQNIMATAAHTWKHWAGADGMDCAIHPTNANIVYGAYQYGTIRKSVNGGTSITSMVQPPEAGSGNWVTPLAIDPNYGSRIYAGYNDLYRHDNSAISGSWVNTTTGITFSGKLSHIEMCPSNSNVIYVASFSQVYRSDNITSGSPTWTTLASTSGTINDIAVDPNDENRVVVVTSFGYVYESTNAGASWTRIDAGLPGSPVKTAVLDRSSDNGIYVAIDGAVYFRSDAVGSWTTFSANLPKMNITELDLYYGVPGESKIRVGTYGRGLWESPLYDDTEDVGGAGTLTCATTVDTYPYSQSFDANFGNWVQSASDDFDWRRQSGGTPSSGTGPSGATDGSHYIYMETSNPNYPSKTAILNSPCFDFSDLVEPQITFSYHMLGSNVGTINLQASTDGTTWTTVWTRSGSQGSAWLNATVDLSSYASSVAKFRFFGTSGTSWQGDICIDKINVTDAIPGGEAGAAFSSTESADEWSIEKVSVFPNPTSAMIYIQVPTNGEQIDLSLTDLAGNIISTTTFGTNEGINLLKISTDDVAAGTYILFIKKGESVLTEKIIVQK